MHMTASGLADAEFREIHDHLSARTGLNLKRRRKEELWDVITGGICKKYPERGFRECFEYPRAEQDGRREIPLPVSRLAVGEFLFFRSGPQSAALRRQVFPDLIEKKRYRSRCLRFRSAGCSTGAE